MVPEVNEPDNLPSSDAVSHISSSILQFTGQNNISPSSILRKSGQTHSESESTLLGVRSGVTPDSVSSVSSDLRLEDESRRSYRDEDSKRKGLRASSVSHSTFSSSEDLDDDIPPPLERLIRQRMVPSAGSHELFLPRNDLDDVITFSSIKGELKRSGVETTRLDIIAQQVLECPPDKTASRRKIFTILCLLRKAPKIQTFIDEGYYDCDLPFDFGIQANSDPTGGFNPAPKFLKSWTGKNIDGFDKYQGQVLAPYFELSNESRLSFVEQNLHHSVVLPFVKYKVKDHVLGKTMQGGFSEVRIVKIHRAHHDYISPDSVANVRFAVKQLQRYERTSEQARVQEVQAYKRLNHTQHPHLTRLLATYMHRKHLHLIFPCASGDLHNLWFDHFPKPEDLERNHKFTRWVSRQLVGVATALHVIHNCDVNKFAADHSSIDAAKTHGRHGDIKPENILWFRYESNGPEDVPFGVLKIADFGLAEFHSPLSLSGETSSVGGITPTYKAPEFDMDRISPKYDIWSFGCVLLQFVVWYLRGWDGVEAFSRKRMDESNRFDHPDDFFNFQRVGRDVLVTEAKQAVRQELADLRAHFDASDYILDLLDLIESRLLRMSAQKRATCDETMKQLEILDTRCKESTEYCTQKRRSITKTATDLSDKVEINLSEKMWKEIIETIDPASPNLLHGSEWSTQSHLTRRESVVTSGANAGVSPSNQTAHILPNMNLHQAKYGRIVPVGLGIDAASNRSLDGDRINASHNTSSSLRVKSSNTNPNDKSNDKSKDNFNNREDKPKGWKQVWLWLRKLLQCIK
ncbi:kinase-like domain-containing protein [Pyrenochaeta sp. MPI-SDFR-AT-0127]|nr:kinase-like domain-containing protein [Pyrenochaeta sp. MPI-SDFR-AT-0127]